MNTYCLPILVKEIVFGGNTNCDANRIDKIRPGALL